MAYRDRDERDAAIQAVLDRDPEAARRFVPDLRRDLESGEDDPRFAIWTLTRLGDTGSLAAIRRVRDVFPRGHLTHDSSVLAELVLTKDEAQIAGRLRQRGPEDIGLIAFAARLIGTDTALDALEECALNAEHWEDRVLCARELPAGRVEITEPEYEWAAVDETTWRQRLRGERTVMHKAMLVQPGEVNPRR